MNSNGKHFKVLQEGNVCAQCVFWVPFYEGEGCRSRKGECHGQPPQVLPVIGTRFEANPYDLQDDSAGKRTAARAMKNGYPHISSDDRDFRTVWPTTEAEDVACGLFRAKAIVRQKVKAGA